MNICIESNLLNHPIRSGLLTYTEGLVYGLHGIDAINNYSLIFYSLTRKALDMPGPIAPNFKKAVIRVPDRAFWKRTWFINRVFLPSFLKRSKATVFHRASGYTMPNIKNIFKVLTIHDLRTLTMGDSFWKQNIESYKKAISIADVCTVVSECTKQDLIKYFHISGKKIVVTYLGADERYQPAAQEAVEQVRVKYDIRKPYFLAIGSIPRKNLGRIMEAYAAFSHKKDVDLVIITRHQLEKFKELSAKLGIDESVIFINGCNDQDLVSLYSGCLCFVFPSLYEGFGLPILEAMKCGTCVITSKTSACPEVAGEAALLVEPEDVHQISEAMEEISRNNALRESLVEKGSLQAQKFSWKKFSKDMLDVYQKA